MAKPDYDTSLARMAGNIASGLVGNPAYYDGIDPNVLAETAVTIARAIVQKLRADAAAPVPLPPTEQGTEAASQGAASPQEKS